MDQTRGRVTKDGIRIYEDADFAGMRAAGRVAAEILDAVAALVVPGTTTAVIDDFITEEIRRRGVTSATIISGSGHAVLDNAALKWVRSARFTPGKLDGVPQLVCGHNVIYEWNLEDARK